MNFNTLQLKRLIGGGLIVMLLIATFAFSPMSSTVIAQEEENCALTPERIMGQAFTSTAGAAFTSTAGAAFTSTAGADGEVALNGMTPDGDDIADDDISFDAESVLESLAVADLDSISASEDVALLIVDDFSSGPIELLEDDELASHGWLVYDVVESLLDELPNSVKDRISINNIDIDGLYYSEDIEALIRIMVDNLHEDDGINHFVVNMSFVFIPCRDDDAGFNFDRFIDRNNEDPSHSLLDELGNSEDYAYGVLTDKRVENINIDNDRLEVDPDKQSNKSGNAPGYQAANVQFLKLLTDNKLQNDPLRTYFADMNKGDLTVIPVASAGNFKLDKPLFPARWREVLSVSATQGMEEETMWSHSNQGEVSAPGAWFTFSDDVQRAGTSFAAPVVSVLTAIDLTQSTPNCGIQGSSPKLGSGNFNNTPISEAADDC